MLNNLDKPTFDISRSMNSMSKDRIATHKTEKMIIHFSWSEWHTNLKGCTQIIQICRPITRKYNYLFTLIRRVKAFSKQLLPTRVGYQENNQSLV